MVHQQPAGSRTTEYGKHERSDLQVQVIIDRRLLEGLLANGRDQRRLLALANKDRLVSILQKMLDESEFLSEHGIRSWVPILSTYLASYSIFLTDFPNAIKTIHGEWMCMDSVTRLVIGLVILFLGCLEVTPTGVVPSVRIMEYGPTAQSLILDQGWLPTFFSLRACNVSISTMAMSCRSVTLCVQMI